MNDYTKQLEVQNEELKAKLAHEQMINAWHNRRTYIQRLHFRYIQEIYTSACQVHAFYMDRTQAKQFMYDVKDGNIEKIVESWNKRFGNGVIVRDMSIYVQAHRSIPATKENIVSSKCVFRYKAPDQKLAWWETGYVAK